jgi:glycosyltransferase involved in cell wall biosynthesis
MNTLISVVLCTYNGEDYLKEQIDSILNQTWNAFELIISDDHSSDNTRSILQTYSAHPSVRLFFQDTNLGPIKNVEFSLRQTKGDFIAFSDQDDIWKPEKLETLFSNIGDRLLVYSNSELVNEKGDALNKNLSDLRNMYSGTDSKGFVFSNVAWGHAMMIRKNLLQYALPIPENIPHDIWLAYIATVNGGIGYIDKVLTAYRQHSKTHTITLAVPATTRTRNKRYQDFERQLNWIEVMKNHAQENEKRFYEDLYQLYKEKQNGKFSWNLFAFLLKHHRQLFRFKRKSFSSNLVEIIKLSRGERNDN